MYSNKDYTLYDGVPREYTSMKNKNFEEWEIAPWDLLIQSDQLLGKGNFGKVFLAQWKYTTVVAKVMNDNIPDEKKELIKREFDVLTKCHHPNIVQLLGYVSEPFIIVMEYLPAGELLNYINHNKFMSKKKKIVLCLDILKGLHYLHSRKPSYVVHRDIKPQNILITPSGVAKIADFGISRLFYKNKKKNLSREILTELDVNEENITQDKTELTKNVGAPRYMAPEIKKNEPYDFKIDIWSAGIIFAELFENERYNKEFMWRSTPKRIKNIIINNMLRNNPQDRFQSNELILLFEQELNYYSKSCCTH